MTEARDIPESEKPQAPETEQEKRSPQLPPVSDSLYQRYVAKQVNPSTLPSQQNPRDQTLNVNKPNLQPAPLNSLSQVETRTFLQDGKVQTVTFSTARVNNSRHSADVNAGLIEDAENYKLVKRNQDKSIQKMPDNTGINLGKISANFGQKLSQILGSRVFWLVLLTALPAAVGITAISLLLNTPSKANCQNVFWATAPASTRLYCAQVKAKKQTADELLEAIELVDILPADNSLRPVVNREIERWSNQVLALGDREFQAGRLSKAIDIGKRIPDSIPNYKVVTTQIDQWQSKWKTAEEIYGKAEKLLKEEKWSPAFMEATKLLQIGSAYWENDQYEKLSNLIKKTRSDGDKLDKARDLADEGGLKNLEKAVDLAREISPDSYIYENAKKVIINTGERLLELAQNKLEKGDWSAAINIAGKIPSEGDLATKSQDFIELARATGEAANGTVAGLQGAIAQAKKIGENRSLYMEAQGMINRWEQEINDVSILEQARSLASGGNANDLRSAIGKLETISNSNSREARSQIEKWSRQLEMLEDQPYLSQAEQLASNGDPQSLEAAIQMLGQIRRGRYLYQEAQNRIQRWQERNERKQDQPLMDQAQRLAADGNLSGAIAVADRILPGRTLYDEARNNVKRWQDQLQSEESLQNARQAASSGTAEGLETAILLAEQVPLSNYLRTEAEQYMNQWGQQILSLAKDKANNDVEGAIAIARKIPSRLNVSTEARSQIKTWQDSLGNSTSYPAESPNPVVDSPNSEPEKNP